ncbi:MAG: septum formation protein Maf [Myxococcales bacterium]|nr:septum formation protein Maf [Myxococcales bacterium]
MSSAPIEAPIVLASASPRRKRMFEEMGIAIEVIAADIDETPLPNETPVSSAVRLAGEKALRVATQLAAQGRRPFVVGADTVVIVDDEVLGKPASDAEAERMLSRLSGRTHCVVTGYAVGRHQGEWHADFVRTDVRFHALSAAQITAYAACGEGRDKAGSYAIQGIGAFLVHSLVGDYFNVVGLPISRVVRELQRQGALPSFLHP